MSVHALCLKTQCVLHAGKFQLPFYDSRFECWNTAPPCCLKRMFTNSGMGVPFDDVAAVMDEIVQNPEYLDFRAEMAG